MTVDDLLGAILGVQGRPLSLEDCPDTISGWDSVTHVQVVLAIEEALGRDLAAAEILKLDSIRAILAIFQGYGIPLELQANSE
jgi:acyl carrier protein